jgi:hypothetical protein
MSFVTLENEEGKIHEEEEGQKLKKGKKKEKVDHNSPRQLWKEFRSNPNIYLSFIAQFL